MLTDVTLPFRSLARPFRGVAAFVGTLSARRASRHALGRLDDHLLNDIGLLPDEARTECAKRFWQD
jgi:uncharacterized protein YjiS (DUF1127 family)